jgi:hypothetical protein
VDFEASKAANLHKISCLTSLLLVGGFCSYKPYGDAPQEIPDAHWLSMLRTDPEPEHTCYGGDHVLSSFMG